ncbi:hypothetical protein PVAND_007258 [Polypedilum vanderplanki]|uniref:Uncharacterized protein n=1 Tax=Polypedilum vanderplanki TaxID=319348 RepID=A0A9J6C798_POLVA|nr:hypothetical protein PVAND_007258 [Polypedilum vanderplanki]
MSSGSEDFGPLMDVLVTCVGAVDVISVLALICNNSSTNTNDSLMDINNNEVKAFQDDKIRDKSPRPMIVIDKTSNGDVIDSLMSKVNELEAKVEELEVRSRECSMERFLDEERERFINTNRLRRSQSPTPDHNSFLEHENESNENDESATDESHVDDITHDDGEIKRSSQVSQQHESREKEINDTNDCTQLAYHSDIDANGESQHHLIESIKEIPTCPKEIESSTLDVNENFIRMEQLQTQSPKMLMKQANVFSEDFPEETINELKKNEEPLPINATESKTAEDIMAHANVSSHPKIEKFPKSNEIETAVDETAIELISTKFESLNLIENEELAKAKEEPSVIVQNYAQVLATETFIDEQVNELPPPPQNVEIINEPQSVIGSLMDVNINPSINLETKDASISANSST